LFVHSAFGLSIGSDVELPGLAPGRAAPDLRIVVRPRRGGPTTAPDQSFAADIGPDAVAFDHLEVGRITIRDGREIVVAPHERADDAAIALFASGPALAVALQQRGALVLHATAVEVRGRAVALLGEKGAGKSTLAAALVARGHALVSDDVVVVADGVQPPTVPAGARALKLAPDAARALGIDAQALALAHPAGEKRWWPPLERGVAPGPGNVPLALLLTVVAGDTLQWQPLTAATLFLEAVRHTYGSRFDFMRRSGTSSRHFHQVSRLVREVPGARLTRIGDLARLDETAALVESRLA